MNEIPILIYSFVCGSNVMIISTTARTSEPCIDIFLDSFKYWFPKYSLSKYIA